MVRDETTHAWTRGLYWGDRDAWVDVYADSCIASDSPETAVGYCAEDGIESGEYPTFLAAYVAGYDAVWKRIVAMQDGERR